MQQEKSLSKPHGSCLVGISATPQAIQMISEALKLYQTVIAVYVNTGAVLSAGRELYLTQAVEYARENDVQVIFTDDSDIAGGLLRIALEQGMTTIIIGKAKDQNVFGSYKNIRKRLDAGNLPMTVISIDFEKNTPVLKRLSEQYQHSNLIEYIKVTLPIIVITSVCFHFQESLGYQTVSLFLLLTIIILPLFRIGRGPILWSTLLSSAIWDFFFIPPHFTFTIGSRQDVVMLFSFAFVALVSSILSVRLVRQEMIIRERENKTRALYNLSKELLGAQGIDAVAEVCINNTDKVLSTKSALFLVSENQLLKKEHPNSTLSVSGYDKVFAAWAFMKNEKTGKFTNTEPKTDLTFYPIVGRTAVVGVVGILLNKKLSFEAEVMFDVFLRHLGISIENTFLQAEASKTAVYKESEKLYNTVLDSLSHELRTPITAILTASESLTVNGMISEEKTRNTLLGEITSAGNRLNNLVQNLLDMARIQSGLLRPVMEWHDIHDMLQSVQHIIRQDFPNHSIQCETAEGDYILRYDYALMEQAFLNIIRNACQVTPCGKLVKISVENDESYICIRVSDQGPGIEDSYRERIFDKFFRGTHVKKGGMGLGLSISRGFINAHSGKVSVESSGSMGSVFAVLLPKETK